MANIQPLDSKKHANFKVKPDPKFKHAQNSHLVPISVFELVKIQQYYPVVFVKDGQTGRFHLVALLGLKPQENLFYSERGWKANYIPQQLLHYPFTLSVDDKQDSHVLCLNFDSDSVGESDGDPLFTASGKTSEFLQHKSDLLSDSISQAKATRDFIDKLAEVKLLAPQSLNIKLANDEEFNLTGLYAIDENKLNEIPDTVYNELRKRGLIGPIYACLFSMHKIANLVQIKAEKNEV